MCNICYYICREYITHACFTLFLYFPFIPFFRGGEVGRQLRVIAVLGKLKGVIWHEENNECAKAC